MKVWQPLIPMASSSFHGEAEVVCELCATGVMREKAEILMSIYRQEAKSTSYQLEVFSIVWTPFPIKVPESLTGFILLKKY